MCGLLGEIGSSYGWGSQATEIHRWVTLFFPVWMLFANEFVLFPRLCVIEIHHHPRVLAQDKGQRQART